MNPVFLLSLPRSGSTLVQRVLASHPQIATTSEPWILLPLLYSLRSSGAAAEYNHPDMSAAVQDFCAQLPNGSADYLAEINKLTLNLYKKVSPENTKYFLDKTPRYHLIIDELLTLFPEGKVIILWRNPLAVAASMMETWSSGKWNLHRFEVDLYKGLANLVKTSETHKDKIFSLQFEQFVSEPDEQYRQLINYLDLPEQQNATLNFTEVSLTGRMGDPTGIKNYQSISTSPLDKWINTLNNPVRRYWGQSYLNWIGPERLNIMGYDSGELHQKLSSTTLTTDNLLSDIARITYRKILPTIEQRCGRI